MSKKRYIANACKTCYADEQYTIKSDYIFEIEKWIDNLRRTSDCSVFGIWEYKFDEELNDYCYQLISKKRYASMRD